MLTAPLEPTDDRADPAFKDAVTCDAWLAQLQLTNLQQAQNRLLGELTELNRYPMRGMDRLATLEALTETVRHIQEDLSKKLSAKPLPLSENEQTVFLSVIRLWQAMGTGYQRGLQACLAGEKQLAQQGALLCQRCLHYSGLAIIEHLRTGYQPAPALWHQLHELYAFAEQQRIHQTKVADPDHAQPTHCVHSYVKTLLICYANPAQMTRRQLQQTDYWLLHWSHDATLDRSYTRSRGDAQPLAADLPGAQGLQRIEDIRHHDEVRYLAMAPISKWLRVKTILLQQGQTTTQVGLGDQPDSAACLSLLTLLHRRWCENRRAIPRRPASQNVAVCGTPYLGLPDSRTSVQSPENWQMSNENISGALLVRTGLPGERLHARQLIALRPAQTLILAATVWTGIQNGLLSTGVRYFPGLPEAVRIRPFGINPSSQIAAAFLLPAVPSLNTPASLIVPRNWFQAGRAIEIVHMDDRVDIVKMGFSVEHGLDYERVSFANLNP